MGGSLPAARAGLAAVAAGNRVYLFGDNHRRNLEYIPVSDAWVEKTRMGSIPGNAFGDAEAGGKIYLLSGSPDDLNQEYAP